MDGMIALTAGALATAMKLAAKVVERRNTIPILQCVLLTASRDGLEIEGCDLDMWFTQTLPASCAKKDIKPFRVAVSADRLREIANIVDAEAQLTLTIEQNGLRINAACDGGETAWTLIILPPDDFPAAPALNNAIGFEMPPFDMQAMICAVRHAISTEETRYYLNGIFIHEKDGRLTVAATDGHRLARWRDDLPGGLSKGVLPEAILPRKAVGVIDTMIDALPKGFDGACEVSLSSSRCAVQLGTARLLTKTIDGTFPDYTRVIPTANHDGITVEANAFHDAIKRARLVSVEKVRAISFEAKAGSLTVMCASADHGRAEAVIGCEDGQTQRIGCNAQYLIDILDRFGASQVRLQTGSPADPMLITPTGADARTLFVLMPMRV
jgi:DNA polymerase III subunit beta